MYVKLHAKENPIVKKLEALDTGRRYADEQDFYHNRPLRPTKEPEIASWAMHHEMNVATTRPEIAYRITLAVVMPQSEFDISAMNNSNHHIHGHYYALPAAQKFSQYLYSPILNDLNEITHLIESGQSHQAVCHLDALKAFLCGEIYG